MERILRTSEWFQSSMPYVAFGAVAIMLCIIAVRVVVGTRAHRVCIALCAVPLGTYGLYCGLGALTALTAGYAEFAAITGCMAVAYCFFSVLFVRLARAI